MLTGVAAFKINKKDNRNLIFFRKKMVTSLANIFTMEKLEVKIIFGSKTYLFTDFQIVVAFLRLLENQKADESTLFLKVFQSNFGMTCYAYLRGKELYTNTQLHIIHGVWELRNLFCELMEWRSKVLKWSEIKFCVV